MKECLECGKPLYARNAKRCKDKNSIKKCTCCGQQFEISCRRAAKRTKFYCSEDCANMGRVISYKENCLKKYGVDNILKVPKVREQIKKTNLEKYGVDNPSKSETIKQKSKKTCIKKYGVEHHMKTEEIKNKVSNTLYEKYGVTSTFQTGPIRDKCNKTMEEKYNTPFSSQVHLDNAEDWRNIEVFLSNNKLKFTTRDLSKYFDTNIKNIRRHCISNNVDNLVKDFYTYSKEEEIIKIFLEKELNLTLGRDFFVHYRQLIKPQEIDFYLPKYNIAIEISPIFTHSLDKKDKYYHQNKFIECKQLSVKLLTYFEYMNLEDFKILIKNTIPQVHSKFTEDTVITNNTDGIINIEGYKEKEITKPQLWLIDRKNKIFKPIKKTDNYEDHLLMYDCGNTIWKKE